MMPSIDSAVRADDHGADALGLKLHCESEHSRVRTDHLNIGTLVLQDGCDRLMTFLLQGTPKRARFFALALAAVLPTN